MTIDEYHIYRLDVLSKTDARNVHFINSQLGRILNAIKNMEYWTKSGNKEKSEENFNFIKEAMRKINIVNQK